MLSFFVSFLQDKATEILALDNRIAELTKYLEKLEHKILAATSEYDEKTELNVAKTLEFGQIKMYVISLFLFLFFMFTGFLRVFTRKPIHFCMEITRFTRFA